METFLLTLHYFLCTFLVIVILLQAGKGADIGAVFGGGSQTVFGSRGPATFLSKLTAVVALVFLVTSIWLAQISKTRSVASVIDKTPVSEEQQAAPAAPEKTAEEKATPEAPAEKK